MAEGRGLITASDLETYTAKWRDPLVFTIDSFRVISAPPPSSGGIAIAQMFGMAEMLGLDTMPHQSAAYVHTLSEIQRRVYADRSEYLGDPDFVQIPVEALLDSAYLRERISNFSRERASLSEDVKAGELLLESMETTHLSVVDGEGNAVSVTTTLNGRYGSKIMVQGAGFFLNNEMDDFSSKPGSPNMFGLVGGKANAIAPRKRMLSSMTPTILELNGEAYLIVGSPGGSTIITSVFQTIANHIYFQLDLPDAVAAPKTHHQWLPDEILYEDGKWNESLKEELMEMGHTLTPIGSLGRVDAILRTGPDEWTAVGDPRGDDISAGIPKNER
jgi:gamma-glutamyltranspeptidase/glutathione hydrolase